MLADKLDVLLVIFSGLLLFLFIHTYLHRKRILSQFDVVPHPLLVTDLQGNIVRVNRSFSLVTGYEENEVLGKKPSVLSSGKQNQDFYKKMWSDLLSYGEWSGELWNKRKNGELFLEKLTIKAALDKNNKPHSYIGSFVDLSERQHFQLEIERLAFYDSLTGLPNRALLSDKIASSLKECQISHKSNALLFIDLDDFKKLNDTYGHNLGDQYLLEVSQRLRAAVKSTDTVCRWGGDEFVVLLTGLSLSESTVVLHAEHISQRIIKALKRPFIIDGFEYVGSASIGVAICDESYTEEQLLKQADIAMYSAKAKGKNQVAMFDEVLQQNLDKQLQIEQELKYALVHNELELYVQPQINESGQIYSAEALIRWHHPTRGILSPVEFIEVAEKSDLIVELGDWVFEQACRIVSQWQQSESMKEIKLAVNISARQFNHADIINKLDRILRRYHLSAQHFKLEITETTIMQSMKESAEKMDRLKSLGFSFSMDDFGTGYSSLSYIQNMPFTQIKLDRQFVSQLLDCDKSARLTKVIIDMADSLGLHLVAEGVETETQLERLRLLGCESYQGFYFAKPMQVSEFVDFAKSFNYESGMSQYHH